MKCLLKYKWVKLPRISLPPGKGVMGDWARLAARAAFRDGKARYCRYINEVTTGCWVGGVVGLKSILGVKKRQQALDTIDRLQALGLISYQLDGQTKRLAYQISDWVLESSGSPCETGTIYATEGYGFVCVPRSITEQLAKNGHVFEEADAWLDLWCHTVWQEPSNPFSALAPAVQFGRDAVLTLDNLGQRWGWEKTKVWRFLHKHEMSFHLQRLPGAYGCLIYNLGYPTGEGSCAAPAAADTLLILAEIRINAANTSVSGTDNARINAMIAGCGHMPAVAVHDQQEGDHGRVAFSAPILRAYFSLDDWNKDHDCHSTCYTLLSYVRGKPREPGFSPGATTKGDMIHDG